MRWTLHRDDSSLGQRGDSLLRRGSLGSSRNLPGEEDCVTSPKSVCVGGKRGEGGGVILLCPGARRFTLTVPLFPPEYNKASANLMFRRTPVMDERPV